MSSRWVTKKRSYLRFSSHSGVTSMIWNDQLTWLCNVLSELYTQPDSSNRNIEEAGLSLTTIALSNKPIDNWHNILKEAAKREKIFAILQAVRREYDTHAELMTWLKVRFRSHIQAPKVHD